MENRSNRPSGNKKADTAPQLSPINFDISDFVDSVDGSCVVLKLITQDIGSSIEPRWKMMEAQYQSAHSSDARVIVTVINAIFSHGHAFFGIDRRSLRQLMRRDLNWSRHGVRTGFSNDKYSRIRQLLRGLGQVVFQPPPKSRMATIFELTHPGLLAALGLSEQDRLEQWNQTKAFINNYKSQPDQMPDHNPDQMPDHDYEGEYDFEDEDEFDGINNGRKTRANYLKVSQSSRTSPSARSCGQRPHEDAFQGEPLSSDVDEVEQGGKANKYLSDDPLRPSPALTVDQVSARLERHRRRSPEIARFIEQKEAQGRFDAEIVELAEAQFGIDE